MKYTHYVYKLQSGHKIVTPNCKPILHEEFLEYFAIVSKWLKDVRPGSYNDINPDPNNDKTYGLMLNKMFEAYLHDPFKGGIEERYFLDDKTLAFIFVVSYFIQKYDRENLDPFLCHVMGNALLKWLPIPYLVKDYLWESAQVGKGSNLSDGFLLVQMFCPNFGFSDYGFIPDVDKALKYATNLYNNPLNKYGLPNCDYAYAKALFEKDKNNAAECIKIIEKKIKQYDLGNKVRMCVLSNYLVLELEILANVSNIKTTISLESLEKKINKLDDYFIRRNQGYYWLAQCYIYGRNTKKDIQKAIKLLRSINDPSLYKKAGISLGKLYLEGNGVDLDAREAFDIAEIAEMQASTYRYRRENDELEMSEFLCKAMDKRYEESYISFLTKVFNKPIHHVDVESLKTILEKNLSIDEYDYFMNSFVYEDELASRAEQIIEKLRTPSIGKELLGVCNRMIYIGTDDNGQDNYLNFEECGNMFIQGDCGAGKTWYLHSIFKRLKRKETYKKMNICFWSFKPFEFEDWCGDYLIKDSHEFIKRIVEYAKKNNRHTMVFIDEFMDFSWELTDEEKNILINLFKESKEKNITFICCSQNMDLALEDFGEYVSTRVCMLCRDAKKFNSMISSDIPTQITTCGSIYVLNSNLNQTINKRIVKIKN